MVAKLRRSEPSQPGLKHSLHLYSILRVCIMHLYSSVFHLTYSWRFRINCPNYFCWKTQISQKPYRCELLCITEHNIKKENQAKYLKFLLTEVSWVPRVVYIVPGYKVLRLNQQNFRENRGDFSSISNVFFLKK